MEAQSPGCLEGDFPERNNAWNEGCETVGPISTSASLESTSIFEGSSSFTHQYAQTKEAIEPLSHQLHTTLPEHVPTTLGPHQSSAKVPELPLKLDIIAQILRMIRRTCYPLSYDGETYRCHSSKWCPLFTDKVLEARPIFLCSWVANDVNLVAELCQKTCFSSDPPSIGIASSACGIIYFIIKEFNMTQRAVPGCHDLLQAASACERAFAMGVQNFEMISKPSFDNILALTLAVSPAL